MHAPASGPLQVKVHRKRQEAEGIFVFDLRGLSDEPLPPYAAGAHIDVNINGFVRQYSLCNDPATSAGYRIGVLREPASRGGSAAMHDMLHEGDILAIEPPRNQFSLSEGDHHSVLVAGGIGITPLLSMAYVLHRQSASFDMHYCARTRGRMAFFEEISAAPFAEKVSFHVDDEAAEQRFDARELMSAVPGGSHIYVCGPAGFLDYVLDAAREAGVPEARLHREYFAAPAASAGHDAGALPAAFAVVLASSGQAYTIEADESITQGLLRQGVEISVSCEQGVCGTCITKVLEGIPDHRDLILTPEEQASNEIFTPCCSRSRSARLVLDL